MKLNKVQTRTIKEFTYTYDSLEELNIYKEIMLKAQFAIESENIEELKITFSQTINKK